MSGKIPNADESGAADPSIVRGKSKRVRSRCGHNQPVGRIAVERLWKCIKGGDDVGIQGKHAKGVRRGHTMYPGIKWLGRD